MGVSFTWKPTDPTVGTSWGSGSTLHSIMEKAFGSFPITLTRDHLKTLEGIEACGYEDVKELVSAILEHDSIDVDAHW